MSARFYLYRRNGTYYFRWSIPACLRQRMLPGSPAEVRISLRTTGYAVARQLAARHWLAALDARNALVVANFLIRYNDVLDAIRGRVRMAETSDDEQRLTLAELLHTTDLRRLHDAVAVLHGAGAEFFIAVPPSEVTIWSRDYDAEGELTDNVVEVLDDFADAEARVTRDAITAALAGDRNAFELRQVTSNQVGFWRGPRQSPEHFQVVLTHPRLCNVSALKVARKWISRLSPVAAADPREAKANASETSPCDPVLLSQARDTWVRANSREGGGSWSKSTQDNYVAAVSQFIDIVGDKLTTKLTAADFADYEALMRRLPVDWANTRRRTGLAFPEIALQGANKAKVSPKTLKDKGGALGTFFRYLQDQGFWHGRYGNSLFRTVRQKARGGRRHVFSDADLQQIYSGRGMAAFEKAKFPLYVWGAILLLFTGARPAEVSQLKRQDVMQDLDGTWYLQFREEDDDEDVGSPKQALKTDASFRAVPLHPVLIDLGFLRFMERFKPGDWLFKEAFRHQQKTSREIGDWVNGTLLVEAGLKAPGVVLYSLRHTVINRFKHDATVTHLACAYTGHSTASDRQMTNREFVETYGKSFTPTELGRKLHPLLNYSIDWGPMTRLLKVKHWA